MSDRPSISVFFSFNKDTDALTNVKVCSQNTCKADFYAAIIALVCKVMEDDFDVKSKEQALEFCKTFIVQDFD